MDRNSIVDEIRKSCFSRGASIGGDPHAEFITKLAYLLRKNNYRVEEEHDLLYNHLTLRTGRVRREHGIIDLFAERAHDFYGERGNHTIAIEYDSHRSLKYKSIEKLLQSNADTLIGIVGNGELSDNKERILEVMNVSGTVHEKVLLITMFDKASEEVYVRTRR